MTEPQSKLPWKIQTMYEDLIENEEGTIVYDSNSSPKDMNYIVEACNNYPKAIQMLYESHINKDNKELFIKIETFLLSII